MRVRGMIRWGSLIASALLLLFLVAMLFGALLFRKNNASPSFFGNTIFIMRAKGMGASVPEGSAVFAKAQPEYNVDDVVLYSKADGYKAVHRIESIVREEDGVTVFSVKGDANDFAEPEVVYESSIIAKVDYYSVLFGGFIVFATSLTGVICLVVLPCLLIVLMEVYRLLRAPKPALAGAVDTLEEPDDADGGYGGAGLMPDAPEEESDLPAAPAPERLRFKRSGEAQYHSGEQEIDPFKIAEILKNPSALSELDRKPSYSPAKPYSPRPVSQQSWDRPAKTAPSSRLTSLDARERLTGEDDTKLYQPKPKAPAEDTPRYSAAPRQNASSGYRELGDYPGATGKAQPKAKDTEKLSVDDILAYIDKEEIKLRFDENR